MNIIYTFKFQYDNTLSKKSGWTLDEVAEI